MSMDNKYSQLRAKALELLKEKNTALPQLLYDNIEKLVEELNVHQIELEMQNEELQQVNKRLALEQTRYKELYMQAPVAYFTLNENGNILDMNQAAADMLGLPIYKIKLTSIFPYLEADSRSGLIRFLKSVTLSNEIQYNRIVFVSQTTDYIFANLSAIKYFDHERNQNLFRCTVVDNTKLEVFANELEQQRLYNSVLKRYENVISASNVGIAVLHTSGTLLECNQAFAQMLGFTMQQLQRTKLDELTHPSDRQKELQALRSISPDTPQFRLEKRYLNANQQQVWVDYNATAVFNKARQIEYFIVLITDISLQKQTEISLRESEIKYRTLVNNSPNAIYKFSTKRGALFWSDRVEEILGYSPTQIYENPFVWNNSIHPNDQPKVQEAIENPIKKERYSIEYRIKTATGQWIWLQDSFTQKKELGDEIIVEGSVRDITHEKKAQDDLLESEEKFRAITAHANDAILLLNNRSEVEYLNQSAQTLFQVTKQVPFSFISFGYLLSENDKQQFVSNFKTLLKSEQQTSKAFEISIIQKKGQTIPVGVTLTLIQISNQPKVTAVIRDISQQKQTNKQKSFLSAIIENTEDICVIKDLDLRVIATNKSFMKSAGKKSIAELIGKTDAEIFGVSPNDYPVKGYMENERKAQKLADGKKIQTEETVIYPDGTKKTMLTSKFPVYANNELIATANISVDITNRKQAEEKIEQYAAQLEEANATKDRFIAVLSHDLKNPFTSLLGFSELLLRNLEQYDTQKIRRFITSINNVSKQTYTLLENLLEWSRTQRNKTPFNPKEVNFLSLIDETITLLKSTAESKQIHIHTHIPQNLKVIVDAEMIKAIVRNLISNAIKFTPHHGHITVSATNQKDSIALVVADTGIGMSNEIQNTLFKIGEGYSLKGTDGETGTGFGLLLCKEFVDKHQGTINVESEIDKGSTFTVVLPTNL